jgi:hypothetical protein
VIIRECSRHHLFSRRDNNYYSIPQIDDQLNFIDSVFHKSKSHSFTMHHCLQSYILNPYFILVCIFQFALSMTQPSLLFTVVVRGQQQYLIYLLRLVLLNMLLLVDIPRYLHSYSAL